MTTLMVKRNLQLRAIVFRRDKGVCAECKADSEKVERVYHAIIGFEAKQVFCKATGYVEGWTFWDADHIQELADGGSDQIGNLQTLCLPCHKVKTGKSRAANRGRPAHGGPLAFYPVRVDEDVKAALKAMKGKFKTINEGLREAFELDRESTA